MVVVVVLVEVVVGVGLTVSKRLVGEVKLEVVGVLDTGDSAGPTLHLAAIGSTVDKLLVVEVDGLLGLEVILGIYALNFLRVADVSEDSRYIVVVAVGSVGSLCLDVLVVTESQVSEILIVVVVPKSRSNK